MLTLLALLTLLTLLALLTLRNGDSKSIECHVAHRSQHFETRSMKKLSKDQLKAFNAVMAGKSIFLTGEAGTGKSWVLKKIVRSLRDKRKCVGVTSTTGVSALNMELGATTLHAYLGIGLGRGSVDALCCKISKRAPSIPSDPKNNFMEQRWKDLHVLIIDEISMLSPELFDKLNNVAKTIRQGPQSLLKPVDRPSWGGIQLILVGDFLQLPVVKMTARTFEAKTWESSIDETHILTTNHRQSTDSNYKKILSCMRSGNLTDSVLHSINQRVCLPASNAEIKPTVLCSTNAAADVINSDELNKLADSDPDIEFNSYSAVVEKKNRKFPTCKMTKLAKASIVPEELEICVGAQVMLLRNYYERENRREDGTIIHLTASSLSQLVYCNGSRGVVVDFDDDNFPVVRFASGGIMTIEPHVVEFKTADSNGRETTNFTLTQIPLKVAYAITIHKAQGLTLDCARIDTSGCFAYGQAYVAFSRVKNLDSLFLAGPCRREHIKTDPECLKFYRSFAKRRDHA